MDPEVKNLSGMLMKSIFLNKTGSFHFCKVLKNVNLVKFTLQMDT